MNESSIPRYADAPSPSSASQLSDEISEIEALCARLADILTRTAVAVRGPGRYGWADLPERATAAIEAAVAAERERCAQEIALLCAAQNVAVQQNEHDMLMTGEELRACCKALAEFRQAKP